MVNSLLFDFSQEDKAILATRALFIDGVSFV